MVTIRDYNGSVDGGGREGRLWLDGWECYLVYLVVVNICIDFWRGERKLRSGLEYGTKITRGSLFCLMIHMKDRE